MATPQKRPGGAGRREAVSALTENTNRLNSDPNAFETHFMEPDPHPQQPNTVATTSHQDPGTCTPAAQPPRLRSAGVWGTQGSEDHVRLQGRWHPARVHPASSRPRSGLPTGTLQLHLLQLCDKSVGKRNSLFIVSFLIEFLNLQYE